MRGLCPFLPEIDRVWRARDLKSFRSQRDADFYLAALSYAQSLLVEGKPAQALLQINKSFLADLDEEAILEVWPPAYEAVVWIIRQSVASENGFLGNPVRHYQHLATRMSGPRAVIRTHRAWACFHLAEALAPHFPRDLEQISEEDLSIPPLGSVVAAIDELGWEGEGNVLRGTLAPLLKG